MKNIKKLIQNIDLDKRKRIAYFIRRNIFKLFVLVVTYTNQIDQAFGVDPFKGNHHAAMRFVERYGVIDPFNIQMKIGRFVRSKRFQDRQRVQLVRHSGNRHLVLRINYRNRYFFIIWDQKSKYLITALPELEIYDPDKEEEDLTDKIMRLKKHWEEGK